MIKYLTVLICFFVSAFTFAKESKNLSLEVKTILNSDLKTGKPLESIEQLIPLLPLELRKNFTFVYNSRSPFKASISADFPRVILFSSDARYILTFTGNPEKPGYDILETLSFNDQKSEFELEAFTLPAARKRKDYGALDTQNCQRCHGTDSRPIFDSYPLWPGFYGSIQDTFPPNSVGKTELNNYQKFLSSNAKSGVYKDLIFTKDSPVSPFLNPQVFRSDKVEGNLNDFRFLPNTRLGMALTELNRKRIYRKLLSSPKFIKKEKYILSRLLNCSVSQEKLNSETIEAQIGIENTDRRVRLGVHDDDASDFSLDMEELKFIDSLTVIKWVADFSNVSFSDWSMAFESNSFSFFDGILSGMHKGRSYYLKEDLIYEILKKFANQDPKFSPFFVSNPVYQWLGYPFGNRIDIGKARKSCSLLK